MPELGSLPIDGPNETLDHRPSGLLDFGQSKVGNLGGDFAGDENVRRLAIPVDDGWLVDVVKVV